MKIEDRLDILLARDELRSRVSIAVDRSVGVRLTPLETALLYEWLEENTGVAMQSLAECIKETNKEDASEEA